MDVNIPYSTVQANPAECQLVLIAHLIDSNLSSVIMSPRFGVEPPDLSSLTSGNGPTLYRLYPSGTVVTIIAEPLTDLFEFDSWFVTTDDKPVPAMNQQPDVSYAFKLRPGSTKAVARYHQRP